MTTELKGAIVDRTKRDRVDGDDIKTASSSMPKRNEKTQSKASSPHCDKSGIRCIGTHESLHLRYYNLHELDTLVAMELCCFEEV